MTDWDARAEELARARVAGQEQERQEWETQLQERREKQKAIWSRLLDVASWAIGRYQAAGVQPLPIYSEWPEEVKPFLRSSRMETRRSQLGKAYPLREYCFVHEGEYQNNYEYWIVFVTSEKRIYAYRTAYHSGSKPDITEIVYYKNVGGIDESQRLEVYLAPVSFDSAKELAEVEKLTRAALHLGGDQWRNPPGIEAACDNIVEYVSKRCNSEGLSTSS